jgi:hypothetical protein
MSLSTVIDAHSLPRLPRRAPDFLPPPGAIVPVQFQIGGFTLFVAATYAARAVLEKDVE